MVESPSSSPDPLTEDFEPRRKRRRTSGLRVHSIAEENKQEYKPPPETSSLKPLPVPARQKTITTNEATSAAAPPAPLLSPEDQESDDKFLPGPKSRDSRSPSGDHGSSAPESDTDQASSPVPSSAPLPAAKLHYKQKLILKGHKKGVSGVKFSPDGKYIASCCTCRDPVCRYISFAATQPPLLISSIY